MLKDKLLLESIERLGFTKVNIGDGQLTQALRKIFLNFFQKKESNTDMAVSHNQPEDERSLEIHKNITDCLKPYFDRCFENYTFLASHFVIKKGKSEEAFQIHQDWNVVDESKYQNYQVWIPLELSYPENGGICFIPESHEFYNNIRSGSLGIAHVPIEEKLYPYLSYLRLFPGDAAVFFSKTFHGSFINSTPDNRVAVLINIIQEKATPLYFHKEKEKNTVEAYKISTESIFKYLPELEKGNFPFAEKPVFTNEYNQVDNTSISAKKLIEKILNNNTKANRASDYEHKTLHILKDSSIEMEINNMGYKVIDLIDEEAIEKLKEKFKEIFPKRSAYKGACSGINVFNLEERKIAHSFIHKTISPFLDKYFKDYYLPISSFYTRKPDNEFNLEWHSDPSFILNEHLESIYGLWCPLVDVDETSGTLKVIPKGHRLLNKLHFTYNTTKWDLESKRHLLDKYQKKFSLKAGQGVLFDARMIHGSEPNKADIHRDNIVMRIAHKKSDYFNLETNSNTANKGKLYKQGKDFFFTDGIVKHNSKPTSGKYAGEFYLFHNEISDDSIYSKLKCEE